MTLRQNLFRNFQLQTQDFKLVYGSLALLIDTPNVRPRSANTQAIGPTGGRKPGPLLFLSEDPSLLCCKVPLICQ